jgi:gamma-glutamylcyclotransferase (GGCT)/AIG2-like uncharacterized protein YtfP
MFKTGSIFMYGSFTEGRPHFLKLGSFVKNVRPAEAHGRVFRLPVGFPVFCRQGEDVVPGQLVDLEAPEILFRLLDEFHGLHPIAKEKSLFFREVLTVRSQGQDREAEAYVVNPARLPATARLIAGGDWQRDLEARPSLLHQLSDRQKDYLRRLGSSRGRDIVPIDLNLYRELMKLDLIVDKGRRLALTRLGKELHRYLDWKWSEVLE